ncbi:immunoglobulin-like domain-containing protein [Hanstruepera neustonica]|uniref:immunoglobulin-like domain-containing protein n=1 Tax=Hanstruepera neustonica TaxID=1445657 RepID=UPI001A9C63B8|nr:immunoglobulin-like domain-containing protein [Hanstruepera neustonica]
MNVVDTTAPTITLNGSATVTVEACGTYNELGATADDGCLAIGAVVIDNSSVDETTVGSYTVTYNVSDAAGNSAVQVTRTVNVVDTTAPTITLNGSSTVTVEACGTYNELGATADDGCLAIGAVTVDNSSVDETTVGSYTVTYNVSDAAGNSAVQVTRTVNVVDTTAPTITLNGSATVTVEACGAYNELGATADDGCLSIGAVVIDNSSVDETTVGSYTVTYNVNDAAGNSAVQVTRTVNVVDTTDPNAICQNITVQLNASGNASITASDINNGSNDSCSTITLNASQTNFDCSDLGNNNVTLTVTDAEGNSDTCIAVVTVQDVTDPITPTLSTITAQCSTTVPTPTTTDGCNGTLTGTTSDPTTYNTQGAYVITWTFDDGNGNSINVNQNVVINDTVDPVANCQNITVPLSDATGTATITPSQINNGSTDNCNLSNLTYSLSQSTFDCTNIGPNIITFTVTDAGGNTDTCTATVTVTSPNINGGNAIGYLTNTETPADSDDIIEVTACPDEPQNAIITLSGHIGNVVRWEYSTNGGLNWTSVANTTTTYNFIDILQTTLVRAVIQIGSCQAYSNLVYVAVVPPDVPPTIVGPSSFDNCIGDVITVTAQSEYGINPAFNEGGLFNQANLNNLGWIVDGAAEMSAGGNNTNDTYWKETNGPKKFNGRCYDSTDNTKFAIVSGVSIYDAPDHTIAPLSTLETPIFNTLGLTNATLEFDQAYYLEAGAWCKIELSVDGGATYNIELDPGPTYNYTGPSDSGFLASVPGFTGQCRNTLGTLVNKHVSIDLQSYIGMTGLRIKFTYSGTNNSAWALDNITIPQAPIDETIEWTDQAGVVVTTGATTTITPITPGVQVYGVTSLINGCRSQGDEGTEFIDVSASLAYAGKDVDLTTGNECGEAEIQLAAYDNTISALDNYNNGVWEPGAYIYPGQSYDHDNNAATPNIIAPNHPVGTGKTGFWSATVVDDFGGCNPTYSFTDINSPNSKFTGEPGEYTLTWTVIVESGANPVTCSSDINVKIAQCQDVDFDGNDDHVVFDDNFDLSGNFSVSAWVKPESIGGDQTIISKRNPSSPNTGYDLRLNNSGRLIFAYNNSNINSGSRNLTTNRWYHVAVVHSGSTYRLYIDGIQINSTTGGAPTANNSDCLLGAVERASGKSNFYNGWMDELRIWNVALNVNQIRETMNQEIRDNAGSVAGEVVPLDIPGLNWTDLDGYYRMGENCGKLTPYAGSVSGKLKNINSQQTENAPIPYTSRVDGQQWATDNTWTHFQVWDAPNSIGIDNSTRIDWNIVQVSHNIDSGNKDITVLGLISDNTNKELTIANPGSPQDETNTGQMLWVTHYLDLDGKIDLVGESQLIQKRYDSNQVDESIFNNTSLGYIERDQQGTSNPFNYNYWSSPVAPNNAAADNSNNYSLSGVLRDGTTTVNNPMGRPINWIGGYTAAASNPAQVSTRWLYAYINNPAEDYYEWEFIGNSTSIPIGLGYTMKGSGNAGSTQNYVYVGKPNNGTISTPIGATRQSLVGNPYPSAIDSRAFIMDNGPSGTNSITGTLYFWEHYTSNATHVTELYEGGYAALNFTGGVGAVQHPDLIISNNGTKIPERYIPVGQGFFVEAGSNTSNVVFNNSQRIYKTEAYTADSYEGSVFVRSSNSENRNEDLIQRIRLRFTSPEGGKRPLLLGFVSNGAATDGVDWAYDGKNNDESTDSDLSWMIEDNRYVIQGVGEFDATKQYPLGLFLSTDGNIKIELTELENFETDIDVYIYDSLLGTYTQINDTEFEIAMDAGEYLDRFFVTFQSESLSVDEFETQEESELLVNYLNNSGEIYINVPYNVQVKQVFLIQILGQTVNSWEITNASAYLLSPEIRIPVKGITDGTYIVKVITKDNQTINKKVVIKK